MVKKAVAAVLIMIEILVLLSGCIGEDKKDNKKPLVEIDYPRSGMTVSNFVMISGTVSDPDGDEAVVKVEVMINDSKWREAEGTIKWSYDWRTYDINEGMYTIRVRSWDGIDYSEVEAITVHIDNCPACSDDLSTLIDFELNRRQLLRLGRFLADKSSDDAIDCSNAQLALQSAISIEFYNTNAEILRRFCICPDCRKILYQRLEALRKELLNNQISENKFPCHEVSTTDMFSYCIFPQTFIVYFKVSVERRYHIRNYTDQSLFKHINTFQLFPSPTFTVCFNI